MKHSGKLTVSKPINGTETYINISLKDIDAGIDFVEVKISLEDFMQAITGLAMVPCEFDVHGIENVGKKIERDVISFEIETNDKELAQKEVDNHTPEGWTASRYFGSQNSFTFKDGKIFANAKIYPWVDKEEATNE